jgi:hypothetical protein
MYKSTLLSGLLRLVPLLTLVACGGSSSSGLPAPGSIRTLAYVVTDVHEDARSASLSQRLEILHDDGPPGVVTEIPTVKKLPLGLGALYGAARVGTYSVVLGAFQRLATSPDGSGVVFEVTFDFSFLAPFGLRNPLKPEQEGIFFVRSDGSGLRRLGPPSREPAQRFSLTSPIFDYYFPFFAFSPNGKLITFMDRGAGPAGEDAPQVVILDIATRARTLTHLPDAAPDPTSPALPATGFPAFEDDDTVRFFSRANPDDLNREGTWRSFTVKTDGTGLTVLPAPVLLPGSRVVPSFFITGPVTGSDITDVELLDKPPVNPNSYYPPGPPFNVVYELFLVSPDQVLQLTNFGRTETGGLTYFGGGTTDGLQVFFNASANPPELDGSNPSENCQIFSISVLGSDLRQLTHFGTADHSTIGCYGLSLPPVSGCFNPSTPVIDPETQTLIFDSTCDPLHTNPNGEQFFAMRSDGTGLRQLTAMRGVVTAADGSVDVELPGPGAYSVPLGILF